jgi:hypothetical protein
MHRKVVSLLMTLSFSTLCFLSPLTQAEETCIKQSPTQVAKAFYTAHAQFTQQDPSTFSTQLTKRFFDALTYEHQCASSEVCAIGFDVWSGAQDGEIKPPMRFNTASSRQNKAVVNVRYTFSLDATHSRRQTAKIVLERTDTKACWVVADVFSPEGTSTLQLIEDYKTQYGHSL